MTDIAPLTVPLELYQDEKQVFILSIFDQRVIALTELKTTIEVHNPVFSIKGMRTIAHVKKIAKD